MRIVLLGGGGHASDVLGAIEAINNETDNDAGKIQVAGVLADEDIDPKRFSHRDIKQLGALSDLGSVDATHVIACVGFPRERQIVAREAESSDKAAATLIHPKAWAPPGTVADRRGSLRGRCRMGVLALIFVPVF
tara:strand:- start:114 stop:518 length:405 start_codon:yes stop_codon:yes gene_type:complete